jgi:hypothetical protein
MLASMLEAGKCSISKDFEYPALGRKVELRYEHRQPLNDIGVSGD